MTFEAGPWHSFGSDVMKKLVASAGTLGRSMSIVDTSDLSARRPDLMFIPDYNVSDNLIFFSRTLDLGNCER